MYNGSGAIIEMREKSKIGFEKTKDHNSKQGDKKIACVFYIFCLFHSYLVLITETSLILFYRIIMSRIRVNACICHRCYQPVVIFFDKY